MGNPAISRPLRNMSSSLNVRIKILKSRDSTPATNKRHIITRKGVKRRLPLFPSCLIVIFWTQIENALHLAFFFHGINTYIPGNSRKEFHQKR